MSKLIGEDMRVFYTKYGNIRLLFRKVDGWKACAGQTDRRTNVWTDEFICGYTKEMPFASFIDGGGHNNCLPHSGWFISKIFKKKLSFNRLTWRVKLLYLDPINPQYFVFPSLVIHMDFVSQRSNDQETWIFFSHISITRD